MLDAGGVAGPTVGSVDDVSNSVSVGYVWSASFDTPSVAW